MSAPDDSDDARLAPKIAPSDGLDPRVHAAWRTWLSALAADAEAAMAAAMTYESLPDAGRDAWLDALEADAPTLDVPKIALYAPVLAMEGDPARRARIEAAIAAAAAAQDDFGEMRAKVRALHGLTSDGRGHVCVIVSPLYLDFVDVLVCRYSPSGGFVSVKHEPMRHTHEVPSKLDGVALEDTPLRVVVEDLAHAVLADRRGGRPAPPELTAFTHLFAPDLDEPDGHENEEGDASPESFRSNPDGGK